MKCNPASQYYAPALHCVILQNLHVHVGDGSDQERSFWQVRMLFPVSRCPLLHVTNATLPGVSGDWLGCTLPSAMLGRGLQEIAAQKAKT